MSSERLWDPASGPLRIAVLVSGHGRGTNLQALLDGCAERKINGEVAVVIGTRADAPAMGRARDAGVRAVVIRPVSGVLGDDYADALMRELGLADVGLVCLAGYMRLLPLRVVEAYKWRIMNTHAALLPLFGGKGMYGQRVHEAVIESGMRVSGCTVHFVDDRYDHGPIILQSAVPVLEDDTPETLAARVLPEEHRTYVRAVSLFSEGRIRVCDGRVVVAERS